VASHLPNKQLNDELLVGMMLALVHSHGKHTSESVHQDAVVHL
jgi:hypothetical protein